MKLLIMIPAHNESKNIELVVNNLLENYSQFDYVVINDCSTDNTAKICCRNQYHCLNLPVNLGLSGCLQTGFRYASEHRYDVAVQLDGDGQHDPAYIQDMLDSLQASHADIVIGSRMKSGELTGVRAIGSKIIRLLISLTTGCRITDPTSGMRMFNRRMIEEFAYNINYAPEPDTLAYLLRNDTKVVEAPVTMNARVNGISYLTATKALEYMVNICVSIIFIHWMRKKRDGSSK